MKKVRRSAAATVCVVLGFAGLLRPEVLCGAETAPELAARIRDSVGVPGGLIVHAGCGDGALTVRFHPSDTALVQGLEGSPEKIAAARQRVGEMGLAGQVAISHWTGKRLPYIDNLVNL
ncbi:MAG: hypothetical protein ACOC46_01940, partial [Pirellulales bacterium]